MDYDDLILQVLQRPEQIDAKSFTHLLIDEFQDINAAQYRLITAWGQNSESIFIIGDPDQSIYGFRGSDYRYFGKFKADFPGTRQIRLMHNYRSTPEIMAAAGRSSPGAPPASPLRRQTGKRPGCAWSKRATLRRGRFVSGNDRLVGGSI